MCETEGENSFKGIIEKDMEALGMNIQGVLIGLSTFLIIGLFHPLVIKGEYYFGKKINVAFLLGGIISLVGAFLCDTIFWASILAILAFSCFWSILEVNHQVRRVKKGWFPMNPKRAAEYMQENEKVEEKRKACSFHNAQTSLTNISITEET